MKRLEKLSKISILDATYANLTLLKVFNKWIISVLPVLLIMSCQGMESADVYFLESGSRRPHDNQQIRRNDGGGNNNPPPEYGEPPVVRPPENPCPPRAHCFQRPGVFHRPNPNNAHNNHVTLNLPPGAYQRIHLRMQFRISDWSAAKPSGIHNIFWLAIDRRHRDLLGYFNAKGPGPGGRLLIFRHGVNLVHGEKPRVIQPILLQRHITYTVSYNYDMAAGLVLLRLLGPNGQVVTEIRHEPNISHIPIGPNNKIWVQFGNSQMVATEDGVPVEVPSYGWEYKNLHVIVYP